MKNQNQIPVMTIRVRENNPHLSADKLSYKNPERIELSCQVCGEPIGFVNFKIQDGKEDICPKNRCHFVYKLEVSKSVPETI